MIAVLVEMSVWKKPFKETDTKMWQYKWVFLLTRSLSEVVHRVQFLLISYSVIPDTWIDCAFDNTADSRFVYVIILLLLKWNLVRLERTQVCFQMPVIFTVLLVPINATVKGWPWIDGTDCVWAGWSCWAHLRLDTICEFNVGVMLKKKKPHSCKSEKYYAPFSQIQIVPRCLKYPKDRTSQHSFSLLKIVLLRTAGFNACPFNCKKNPCSPPLAVPALTGWCDFVWHTNTQI